MADQLPKAVRESVLTVAGVTIRVYHLDDGRRVLDVDDVDKFTASVELTEEMKDRIAADLEGHGDGETD